MQANCQHARAYPVARAGILLRKGGGEVRGNLLWCMDCGAVRGDVQGEPGDWLPPSGPRLHVKLVSARHEAPHG
jgi:hypothetical protein